MTAREIHAQQVRLVHQSMYLAESRTDRHNVTRLSQYRPCARCGEARSFYSCARCDRPVAA